MPEPIQSSPGPLVCQSEGDAVIELDPVLITGDANSRSLIAPVFDRSIGPADVGSLALSCASELDGLAIVAVGAGALTANPLLIGLGAAKAGLDFERCAGEAEAKLLEGREVAACRAEGGLPIPGFDHEVLCFPRGQPGF